MIFNLHQFTAVYYVSADNCIVFGANLASQLTRSYVGTASFNGAILDDLVSNKTKKTPNSMPNKHFILY